MNNTEYFSEFDPCVQVDDDECIARTITTLSTTEIMTIKNRLYPIDNHRRMSGNRCVNLETGEVIDCKKPLPRNNGLKNLHHSNRNLIRLMNNNFVGDKSERHVVLTYAKQVDNYQQVNRDYKNFWLRLKYRHPTCEYIKVVEQHSNGSFHIHVLIKDMKNSNLYIEYSWLRETWGLGRVHVSTLPFSANYGAYFAAHVTNQYTDHHNSSKKAGIVNEQED